MKTLKQWLKSHKTTAKKLSEILDLPYITIRNIVNFEETRAYPLVMVSLYTGIPTEHLLPFDTRHKIKELKKKLKRKSTVSQVYNTHKLDIGGISYLRFSQFGLVHIDEDIVQLKSVNGEEHHINLSTFKRYFKESPKNRFNDLIEEIEQEEIQYL